jgi:hypothetical protein
MQNWKFVNALWIPELYGGFIVLFYVVDLKLKIS